MREGFITATSCSVGHGCRSDPMWLSMAVVEAGSSSPIRPLAWELLYAAGAALKRTKKKKKKKKNLWGKKKEARNKKKRQNSLFPHKEWKRIE